MYGVELLISASNKLVNMIEVLNNRLLRILQFKNSRVHVNDLYSCYNILPLRKLIQYNLFFLYINGFMIKHLYLKPLKISL